MIIHGDGSAVTRQAPGVSAARRLQQRQLPGHGSQQVTVTEPAAQGKQGHEHVSRLGEDRPGALGVRPVTLPLGEDGIGDLA
jgi:hypothetical protein